MNRKEICELLGLEYRESNPADYSVPISFEVNIGWLMARVYSAIQVRLLSLSDIENCGLSFSPVAAFGDCLLMMSQCGKIIALTGDRYELLNNLYAVEVYEVLLKYNKLDRILPDEIIEEIKRLEALEDEAVKQYNRDRDIAKLKELAKQYPEAL